MTRCPHCGQRLADQDYNCPTCSKPVNDPYNQSNDYWDTFADARSGHRNSDVDGEDDPMVTVVRFKNSAEAGYFTYELMQHERIPVTLNVDESFDAATGSWSIRFLLMVPESVAERAAIALQRMIEQTDDDEFFDEPATINRIDPLGEPAETLDAENSGVNWIPIVLTLAAGSVVLWGSRKLPEQPRAVRPVAPVDRQHDALWKRLATSTPWIQPLDNGRGQRELRIDRERSQAIILEDADGDGVFESRLRLQRTAPQR